MLELCIRKRTLHGVSLYWLFRKPQDGKPYLYTDIHAPTGYGFKSKAKAERIAQELERERNEPLELQYP